MRFIFFLIVGFLGVSTQAAENVLSSVHVPPSLRQKLESFEPSAGIYLPELKMYLVASDDTTSQKDPWLFLMNEQGEVQKNPVRIQGLKSMTDIESLSQDEEGFIYVLSSQGLNKSGKNKKSRNLFVKAVMESNSLKTEKSIELRPLLLKALKSSQDGVLQKMRDQFDKLLDVESHFIKNGELYVGLKEPQPTPNHAVIVNLGRVDDVLSGQLEAHVWHILDLTSSEGVTNRLSDMAWDGQDFVCTSTSDEGYGHLWQGVEKPVRLLDFSNVNPEAVVLEEDQAMLLFDQGTAGDGLYLNFN